ncbi:YitT family protein, partial [Acinetobacter sp. 163]|nr:YitT family protein [Acinetobacter sp. 163]
PHISLGKIAFAMDIAVVLIGVVVVSKSIDSLIYGAIVSYLLSVVVDKVMYGVDAGKLTFIVSDYPKEVAKRIDE